jgi:ribonuclease HI
MPKKTVTLYTDGSCSGNPGPGGWAALLRYEGDGGVQEKAICGAETHSTNNRMEMMAVIEGLRALREPVRVLVHADSAYVVNAFKQNWIAGWQKRNWTTAGKKPVKNQDLWRELIREVERHDVEWVKVKGHADDELNNRVDRLAVEAMKHGPQGGQVEVPRPEDAEPAG